MIRSAQPSDLQAIQELVAPMGVTVNKLYPYTKVYERNGRVTAVIGAMFNRGDFPVVDILIGNITGRISLIRDFEAGLRRLMPEGPLHFVFEVRKDARLDSWRNVAHAVADKYADAETTEWYVREIPENAKDTLRK